MSSHASHSIKVIEVTVCLGVFQLEKLNLEPLTRLAQASEKMSIIELSMVSYYTNIINLMVFSIIELQLTITFCPRCFHDFRGNYISSFPKCMRVHCRRVCQRTSQCEIETSHVFISRILKDHWNVTHDPSTYMMWLNPVYSLLPRQTDQQSEQHTIMVVSPPLIIRKHSTVKA